MLTVGNQEAFYEQAVFQKACSQRPQHTARSGDCRREEMPIRNYSRLALNIKQSRSKLVSAGILSWMDYLYFSGSNQQS